VHVQVVKDKIKVDLFNKSPLVVLILIIVLSGCQSKDKELFSVQNLQWEKQGYIDLPEDELPYSSFQLADAKKINTPFDSDSIEMFEYRGMVSYHPVSMGQRCRTFINAYRQTKDKYYLHRAEKYADKLMTLADTINSAKYLRYSFTYAVHSDSANLFTPPWYSGMAEGVMLMDFCRLYDLTGELKYKQFADDVFKSFLALRRDHATWTVRVDTAGYYWVEEYPHDSIPGMTLNGYNSAICGLYEYFRLTKKPEARKIYELALTTIKHYLPEFRVVGQRSYYCLGHKVTANPGYHRLHITQMGYLYRMTGDNFFKQFADSLEHDVSGQ